MVSAVGLGCMGMSMGYGPGNDAESLKTIHRAASVHPIAAVQTEYSLWERYHEKEILPTCEE